MYIDRIRLENIRGFEELDLTLQRPDGSYAGWTVFTGENGSGKSTLLKAIAVVLAGSDTAKALQPSFQGWIKHSNNESSVQLQLKSNSVFYRAILEIKNIEKIIMATNKEDLENPEKSTTLKPLNGYMTFWKDSLEKSQIGFCCGYGPFRRVFGASSEAEKQMSSLETARFATLFNEAASLSEADRWIKDLKFKSLVNKEEEKSDNNESKLLEIILKLLSDDLLPSGIKVDKVDSDGLWLKDKNDLLLTWRDMSDGYRSALALLIDIVKNMVAVYGTENLATLKDGEPVVFNPDGVVLIDEIDAHLHPSWQRDIGFWLTKHFPNIQFLVTTHSPIILQAADPNGLFVLPSPSSDEKPRPLTPEEHQRVIASRPDQILLTPAFGLQNTRSPVAVEKRAELAELNSKKQAGAALSDQEQEKYKQLLLWNPE